MICSQIKSLTRRLCDHVTMVLDESDWCISLGIVQIDLFTDHIEQFVHESEFHSQTYIDEL